MNTIDFFKLQSKNLHRDFKTRKLVFDNEFGGLSYEYEPKHFDIELVIYHYKIAKLLYENQHKVDLPMWLFYLAEVEEMNQTIFDSKTKLAICEDAFEREYFDDSVSFDCYLLDKK